MVINEVQVQWISLHVCQAPRCPIFLSHPFRILCAKETASRIDNTITGLRGRNEIIVARILASNCVHFFYPPLRPSYMGRFITEREVLGARKGENRKDALPRASSLPVIKRSYLSFLRTWKEFQRERRYRIILYIFRIDSIVARLISTFSRKDSSDLGNKGTNVNKSINQLDSFFISKTFNGNLNFNVFHVSSSQIFANYTNNQFSFYVCKKKRKMKETMLRPIVSLCYGAYGVDIHSSPVTNRSVKESKFTVRFGLRTRLHGCYEEHMCRLCKDA